MRRIIYGSLLALGLVLWSQNHVSASTATTLLSEQTSTERIASLSLGGSTVPTREVQSNGTVVILPASYNPQKSYPALVILPPTNRTASQFFNWALNKAYQKRTSNPFIVILPPDRGTSADYSSGEEFEATIARFERSVRQDLRTLIPKYNIRASQVGLGGFSMGADLAWAVSLRNPGLFKGAILIDSLCSYRLPRNMNRLADKQFRFFMIAGQKEASEASHPMRELKTLLDQRQIPNVYKSFPDADHATIVESISDEMWMRSVDYVLFR